MCESSFEWMRDEVCTATAICASEFVFAFYMFGLVFLFVSSFAAYEREEYRIARERRVMRECDEMLLCCSSRGDTFVALASWQYETGK